MSGVQTAIRSDDLPINDTGKVRPRLRSLLIPWGAAIAIVAAAWVIRAAGITANYDIFIDEVTYTRVAENLATGRGLTLYGTPFDLHPPAGFAIMAAAIKIFSMQGSLATVLIDLRPFVALFGALTCGLVFLLVARLTSWPVGLIAAAIIALDPFEIYYDSHVMLEGPGQLATTASVLLLVSSIGRKERESWLLTGCSGLAAGLALCIKENFGLVLAGVLLLAIVLGWAVERAKAALSLTIMIGCYLLSQSLLVLTSGLGPWWDQVDSGLSRLVGVRQTTGFNSAAVHVSVVSRLAANATHFGITYLILGLGAVASVTQVISAIRHRAEWRGAATPMARSELLVALWGTAAVGYLGYATAFGTLEEQMYYVLLGPATCTLVIWCRRHGAALGTHWRKILTVLAVLVVLADGTVWAAVHSARDDAYLKLLSWAPKNLPKGTTIAVTEGTAQFLMQGVVLGQWNSVPELIAHHVDYVLLNVNLASQGYGIASSQFEDYLERHVTIAWEATGPTSGALILFDVRRLTGAGR